MGPYMIGVQRKFWEQKADQWLDDLGSTWFKPYRVVHVKKGKNK